MHKSFKTMIKIDKGLLKGSLVLLVMFNLFNLINFIFQLTMARMLTIGEYGTLATIFSLIYVMAIFSESIQTVVAKFSSVEDEKEKIKNVLKRALRRAGKSGVLFLIAYLLISIGLSYLLEIDYALLALNGLIVLAAFVMPVMRGVLQGKEKFVHLGANMIVEALVKIIFAVILVLIGWGVYGAIGASIVGSAVAFVVSVYFLKEIVNAKEKDAKITNYKGFSLPVLYIVAIIFIFFSLDIIIARIVFEENFAGMYAVASTLGKIIFLGVQPISKAMFPIVSSSKKKVSGLLRNSIFMISILILLALFVFYFFPDLIIMLFSGKNISEAASILFLVGVAFSLQSITNVILLYKLAGSIRNYIPLAIIIPIQAILLILFSSSLLSFSLALVGASAIFLIGSIILTKTSRGEEK